MLAAVLGVLVLLGSGLWAPPAATAITGPALVIDGDTIALRGVRVRLFGIDAPELEQSCGRDRHSSWACGREAAAHLTRLISGGAVACQPRGYDTYGRVLGVCVAGGNEINAQMVRSGMAWAFDRYAPSYLAEETEARARKLGIWRGEAEPAWSYRARRSAEAGH
jgi:endonuclease YncB( thermonuclease family)